MPKIIEVDLLKIMDMLEAKYEFAGDRWNALRDLVEAQETSSIDDGERCSGDTEDTVSQT